MESSSSSSSSSTPSTQTTILEAPSSSSSTLISQNTILDIPSDLLLWILSRLDGEDRHSFSVVSKHFSLIYGLLIRKLSIHIHIHTPPNNDAHFTKIFTRFSLLKKITLRSTDADLSHALTAISNSNLNLEALALIGCPKFPNQRHMCNLSGRLKIKTLTLGWFSDAGTDQIIRFILLFEGLEELCFERDGELWFDGSGFKKLCQNVPHLKTIDGIWSDRLSDDALEHLSIHCEQLKNIGFGNSFSRFTPEYFGAFLKKKPNLMSLQLPRFSKSSEAHIPLLAEAVSTLEDLHHLTITSSFIKDDVLPIIARSDASLTTLHIGRPNNDNEYTIAGLSTLLNRFQGLTRLNIWLPRTDSEISLDRKMGEVVSSLPSLNDIVIHSHTLLFCTLFSLIENCPMIRRICLCSAPADRDPDYRYPILRSPPKRMNYSLRHLSCCPVPHGSFKTWLASYCPNLTRWDVEVWW